MLPTYFANHFRSTYCSVNPSVSSVLHSAIRQTRHQYLLLIGFTIYRCQFLCFSANVQFLPLKKQLSQRFQSSSSCIHDSPFLCKHFERSQSKIFQDRVVHIVSMADKCSSIANNKLNEGTVRWQLEWFKG